MDNSLCSLINIDIGRKEMICLVGAGGKTSAMFRIAEELASKGKKVLATTTTAICLPEEGQYDNMLVSEEENPGIFEGVNTGRVTVFGRTVSYEGKLMGVKPEFLDIISQKGIFDYIIVEGDGSKGRPIKAPAYYEPVIPSCTTKLLGIIGLDSIGKGVSEEYVHRPELFRRITGCAEGDVIDAEAVIRLIAHEEGLFKVAPCCCEKYLVLNKADEKGAKSAARDIVGRLREKDYGLSGIVISSMKASRFHRVDRFISGIILAAGLSRRMGTNKLLLPVGKVPVIERVLSAAESSKLGEIILVCGSEEMASIGRDYGARCVLNTDPYLGQSHSVRLGAENSHPYADGFMFLVGDQPFITEGIINNLIDAFSTGSCSAAVPLYKGKRGNPVIFSSKLKERLVSLSGDAGGRVLLEELRDSIVSVDIADEKAGTDFDTQEEYQAVLELEGKMNDIIVIRSAGDIATAIAHRLHKCGFRVLLTELQQPLAVRRLAAFAEAVRKGKAEVEGVQAIKVEEFSDIYRIWEDGCIPVYCGNERMLLENLKPLAFVDATLAKRNNGTHVGMAPIVIGVGPGFEAGLDVDAVVETNRGHNLGKVIYKGCAEANTGIPGEIMGYTMERLLRAPAFGKVSNVLEIGDMVKQGDIVAYVAGEPVYALVNGVVRGLIANGTRVSKGLKIGDIDPRGIREYCSTISDKARAVAGGVLEAILCLKNRLSRI